MKHISILDLNHSEQNTLDQLLTQLDAKKSRNSLRAEYYESKSAARDVGISTPPMMRRIATVLGWPAKAVDLLNNRCNLDGFVLAGSSAEDLGIPELVAANRLDVDARKAGTSALIHSLAFLIATLGDEEAGEPAVVITPKSAMFGTGLWDVRRRALSAFLSVIDSDDSGDPIEMVMYHSAGHVEMTKTAANGWRVGRREHSLGRVPVEMLTFKSDVDNAFGTSRISRAIMSYTDQGVRATIRSEVGAEFYSSPQRYLLGADESAFQDAAGNVKTQWQAILGRVWAIDADEDGNTPTVGQFPQMTQQPHIDQLRWIAQAFAGEASIPAASLGITTDANPASAEAYHASREDLIQLAENTTDEWSPAWCRTMLTAVQLRDGLDEIPAELTSLRAKWRNPATPSRAAAADAGLKTIQAFPWIAETEVGLEMMGFDQTTIDRLLAEKRRMGGSAALRAITDAAAAGRPVVTSGDAVAG